MPASLNNNNNNVPDAALNESIGTTYRITPDPQTGEHVVTILFNGTCSSINDYESQYYPNGETIAYERHNVKGLAYGFDGPGSDAPLHKDINPALQVALGWGIERNISTVIEDLVKLHKDLNISKINIAGWSRGGAAAITCASQLFKQDGLNQIPVHIFAIDPVPGLGNANNDNLTLSPNVKDAVFVYAENEKSIGFSPVIPVRAKGSTTNIKCLKLPGHHATLAGNPYWRYGKHVANRPEINLADPGVIVRWMLEEFLLEHGTQLGSHTKLSKAELLTLFDKIKQNKEIYKQLETEAYTGCQIQDGPRKLTNGPSWLNSDLQQALAHDYQYGDDYINALHAFINNADDGEFDFSSYMNAQQQAAQLDDSWIDMADHQSISVANKKLLQAQQEHKPQADINTILSKIADEIKQKDEAYLKQKIELIGFIDEEKKKNEKLLQELQLEKEKIKLTEQQLHAQAQTHDGLQNQLHEKTQENEAINKQLQIIDAANNDLRLQLETLQHENNILQLNINAIKQRYEAKLKSQSEQNQYLQQQLTNLIQSTAEFKQTIMQRRMQLLNQLKQWNENDYQQFTDFYNQIALLENELSYQDIHDYLLKLYDHFLQQATLYHGKYEKTDRMMIETFKDLPQKVLNNEVSDLGAIQQLCDELNTKLACSAPISLTKKAFIAGVIGALVGFVLGAIIGGIVTMHLGGWGAVPTALLAAVTGFKLGTAIGLGGAAGLTLFSTGATTVQDMHVKQKYLYETGLKNMPKPQS